jgi:hypothetical protein
LSDPNSVSVTALLGDGTGDGRAQQRSNKDNPELRHAHSFPPKFAVASTFALPDLRAATPTNTQYVICVTGVFP